MRSLQELLLLCFAEVCEYKCSVVVPDVEFALAWAAIDFDIPQARALHLN